MGILDSASSRSVDRGFDYFKEEKVKDAKQISESEYEGCVEGSLEKAYYTKINVIHPKQSYCDCPHANGNIICKHMVALYFTMFENDATEYEEWLYLGDDEDDMYYEDDEDEYGADYDDERNENAGWDKPLFYDLVLHKFIDSLTKNELKEILKTELEANQYKTYHSYLHQYYQEYLNDDHLKVLETLNEKVNSLRRKHDYYFHDYDQSIFTNTEKEEIETLYQLRKYVSYVDKIMMDPKLAEYRDYQSLVPLIKKYKKKAEILTFLEKLNNHLVFLKNYKIKDSEPKENVLITMYLLSNETYDQLANAILRNAKYHGYIEFVIADSQNILKLYKAFKQLIDKNYHKNKTYIPDVLAAFIHHSDFHNRTIFDDYYFYAFLCTSDVSMLKHYDTLQKQETFIKAVEGRTNHSYTLMKLYAYFNKVHELWNLLMIENNNKYLIDYCDVLKDEYQDSLYKYFKKQFYNVLSIDKKREIYKEASIYMKAIHRLNDGEKLVNEMIDDLSHSTYAKCSALFEEINRALQ